MKKKKKVYLTSTPRVSVVKLFSSSVMNNRNRLVCLSLAQNSLVFPLPVKVAWTSNQAHFSGKSVTEKKVFWNRNQIRKFLSQKRFCGRVVVNSYFRRTPVKLFFLFRLLRLLRPVTGILILQRIATDFRLRLFSDRRETPVWWTGGGDVIKLFLSVIDVAEEK